MPMGRSAAIHRSHRFAVLLVLCFMFICTSVSMGADQPRDPYRVLGVAKDASSAELRKAYRTLALRYHPDKQTGDEKARSAAEKKFVEISEAYELLSDDQRRQEYDQFGFKQQSAPPPPNYGQQQQQQQQFHQQGFGGPGGQQSFQSFSYGSAGGGGGFGAGDAHRMFEHFFGRQSDPTMFGGMPHAKGERHRTHQRNSQMPQQRHGAKQTPELPASVVALPPESSALAEALTRRAGSPARGRIWLVQFVRESSSLKAESSDVVRILDRASELMGGLARAGQVLLPDAAEGTKLLTSLASSFGVDNEGVYVFWRDTHLNRHASSVSNEWRATEYEGRDLTYRRLSNFAKAKLPARIAGVQGGISLQGFLRKPATCKVLLFSSEPGAPIWLHRLASAAAECSFATVSSADKVARSNLEQADIHVGDRKHCLVVIRGDNNKAQIVDGAKIPKLGEGNKLGLPLKPLLRLISQPTSA